MKLHTETNSMLGNYEPTIGRERRISRLISNCIFKTRDEKFLYFNEGTDPTVIATNGVSYCECILLISIGPCTILITLHVGSYSNTESKLALQDGKAVKNVSESKDKKDEKIYLTSVQFLCHFAFSNYQCFVWSHFKIPKFRASLEKDATVMISLVTLTLLPDNRSLSH